MGERQVPYDFSMAMLRVVSSIAAVLSNECDENAPRREALFRPSRKVGALKRMDSRNRLPRGSFSLGGLLLCCLFFSGCASAPKQPPGEPPTPETVNRENPGGDAHDPQLVALRRQLESPWGARRDKDNQLIVPLPDYKNYKRVRFWAIEHFVGFRYGKDYYVMNAAFVQDVPDGVEANSKNCLRRMEKWGRPQIKSFDIKLGPAETVGQKWRGEDISVKVLDGHLDFGFKRRRFSAAYAAYPAYQHACLVFGMVVPWDEHEELAKQVRDRWVAEGVPRLVPLTETRPFRK